LPQVPRHQATLQARYESRWRLGLQARWTSAPFEDDRNELALDPAMLVDLSVGRVVAAGVELFAAAENVLDAEVVVARTPVPSLGAPRMLRAGVRLVIPRAPVHSSRAVVSSREESTIPSAHPPAY
jgi:outer membrane receptor protein involved in Fe transport